MIILVFGLYIIEVAVFEVLVKCTDLAIVFVPVRGPKSP